MMIMMNMIVEIRGEDVMIDIRTLYTHNHSRGHNHIFHVIQVIKPLMIHAELIEVVQDLKTLAVGLTHNQFHNAISHHHVLLKYGVTHSQFQQSVSHNHHVAVKHVLDQSVHHLLLVDQVYLEIVVNHLHVVQAYQHLHVDQDKLTKAAENVEEEIILHFLLNVSNKAVANVEDDCYYNDKQNILIHNM